MSKDDNVGERTLSTDDRPDPWLLQRVDNWMQRLPDDVLVSDVTIPGTHDSGACYGPPGYQTQTWSIDDQLSAGIRFFDIRAAFKKVRKEKGEKRVQELSIFHGTKYMKQSLENVLDTLTKFLTEHPTEFIVMRLMDEHPKKDGLKEFRAAADPLLDRYASCFAPSVSNDPVPIVADVRGKVLLLRDAPIAADYGMFYSSAAEQNRYKVYWLAKGSVPRPLRGQVSLGEKKDEIKKHMKYPVDHPGRIALNYLSGSIGMLPIDVARATNQFTYDEVFGQQGSFGILIADFPGEGLIDVIVNANP